MVDMPCHTQGQFHLPGLPSLSLSASLDIQPLSPMSSSGISEFFSPQPRLLGTPHEQTAYTLGIIGIFDNQKGVGWFQHSKTENGHHKSVGPYNSRRPLMYQVLPL